MFLYKYFVRFTVSCKAHDQLCNEDGEGVFVWAALESASRDF